jgi:apolipoprotein N-acyltransferase
MRAIEEGLPMVSAANTGISAVIDPSGRIVARLGLGIEGVLDANLPAPLPPTHYARLRDIPTMVLMAAALLFIFRRRWMKRAA